MREYNNIIEGQRKSKVKNKTYTSKLINIFLIANYMDDYMIGAIKNAIIRCNRRIFKRITKRRRYNRNTKERISREI